MPFQCHYNDIIMTAMASQITSLAVVYSIVYSDAHQRKHQSSASLAFVWGIHRWLVNSPHKGPVTRKMFPFDDVIMVVSRMARLIDWFNYSVQIERLLVITLAFAKLDLDLKRQSMIKAYLIDIYSLAALCCNLNYLIIINNTQQIRLSCLSL